VRVSCVTTQALGSLLVPTTELTRECLIQEQIDLRPKFRRIYAFQFMNLHTNTFSAPIPPKSSMNTDPLPIQEKPKGRRSSDVILARDHRAQADAQINLGKRDLTLTAPESRLLPRELLEHGLDQPARPARRRREHGDDGAVRREEVPERRRVHRRVDRPRRRRAVARVRRRPWRWRWYCARVRSARRAIGDGLQEGGGRWGGRCRSRQCGNGTGW